MAGTIESGSRVWVRSQLSPLVGEVWAVVTDDGDVVVHRVREVSDDAIVTRGTGNPIDDAPLPQARLVGRVAKSRSPSGRQTAFGDLDRRRAAAEFALRRLARQILRRLHR
jgi:phage repressor protein C with HTH and peptisase S24 domain